MNAPRLRLVHLNDVYELVNLPKLQTFITKLAPHADAVVLSGDFLSPSTLSALDGGKGMVAALRAIGLTHVSIGNHEHDLKPVKLQKRFAKLQKNVRVLNSNIDAMSPRSKVPFLADLPRYDIISTSCGSVKVGLMGLLSDEPGIFRDNTFRGAQIANVCNAYSQLKLELLKRVDLLLPLTHQTIHRDKALGAHMLKEEQQNGLILGGHEHVPMDETVHGSSAHVRIIKSGSEAEAVSLIDLVFDRNDIDDPYRLVDLKHDLVEMGPYDNSVAVKRIVDSHIKLLHDLENEEIVHAESLLPPGVELSTKRTRYKQTTGGSILCRAMKEELEVDVCVLNGATIKGDKDYRRATMSYAELKKELPFPTKIITVPMKRWQLQDAIHYSRTHPPNDPSSNQLVERKGYLQVDVEFDRLGFHTGDQDDDLIVALPRNLLKGFCDIQPLIDLGNELEKSGCLPGDDDYIPALQLIIRYFSKEKWYELVQDNYSFHDLDEGHKGYLTRDDVSRVLRKAYRHDVAEFVIDDMMDAVDADDNGTIDPGEFSHLLAEMEREHGLIRFD